MWLIIAIIVINAVIGFIQEFRAERSVSALKKMIVPIAHVYRDGQLERRNAVDLVPGDIVLLQEGDKVPADGRLIQVSQLMTTESSLTGESLPVEKDPSVLDENTPVADRSNMVWMGTTVCAGEGLSVVTNTGANTAIGEVAASLEEIEVRKGPFWRKTRRLALQLGMIALVGAFSTFIIGYFIRGIEFNEIFLFTLASLVAGIPEGLPAVIIIVLAIGANRMARRNVLIRNLPATETLGHATVIATDKTGTITQNSMNVERIVLPSGRHFSVTGTGWETTGEFTENNGTIDPATIPDLATLLHIAALCNSARLIRDQERLGILGDPTEAALAVAAARAGITPESLASTEKRIRDMPFNKDRRFRASLIEAGSGIDQGGKICVVGAPETVLLLSDRIEIDGNGMEIAETIRAQIIESVNDLSAEGMRVIALAWKRTNVSTDEFSDRDITQLCFAGVAGMRDPVRPEVAGAIASAKNAGIRVIMKTGDHKGTASAIAGSINLISTSDSEVLTESDIIRMKEPEFKQAVDRCNVFARLTPATKLRIVSALQDKGEIVAMTGDGVNDAPALKKADIGIAMGVCGTDVARAASEMVLADDNFASIVQAVREGRIVFHNIRRVTWFLVTTNLAEDITIITALLLGFPLPILPVHILWLNLITDGVVVLALAAEPGHRDVLTTAKPESSRHILTRQVLPWFVLMTILMTACTIYIFNSYLPRGIEMARTGAFAMLAVCQLFNVLNMRSLDQSVFKLGLFTNKFVIWAILVSLVPLGLMFYVGFFQEIFQFEALTAADFLTILLLGSSILVAGELLKLLKRLSSKKNRSDRETRPISTG